MSNCLGSPWGDEQQMSGLREIACVEPHVSVQFLSPVDRDLLLADFRAGVGETVQGRRLARRRFAHQPDERIARHHQPSVVLQRRHTSAAPPPAITTCSTRFTVVEGLG